MNKVQLLQLKYINFQHLLHFVKMVHNISLVLLMHDIHKIKKLGVKAICHLFLNDGEWINLLGI
jgi:hypothetical protein